MTCSYLIGHEMPCDQLASNGAQHCAHHQTRRCVSCRNQATHNCTNEKTSICGNALCDECEHVELPNGANGMFYQHAIKGQEPVIPHYGKEAMKSK
jgi:hypothetical protein